MADTMKRFDEDMEIIGKLDDEPNDVDGMSAEELKAAFDRGGKLLQEYINEVLLPELEACGVTNILRRGTDNALWMRVNSDRVIEFSQDGEYWMAAAGPGTTVYAGHRDMHRAGGEDAITPEMIGAAVRKTFTATVSSEWVAEGDWFYQDISVPGILETDEPDAGVLTGSDNEANLLYDSAMGRVFRISTGDGTVRVWATDDIGFAFPIQLKVVR